MNQTSHNVCLVEKKKTICINVTYLLCPAQTHNVVQFLFNLFVLCPL